MLDASCHCLNYESAVVTLRGGPPVHVQHEEVGLCVYILHMQSITHRQAALAAADPWMWIAHILRLFVAKDPQKIQDSHSTVSRQTVSFFPVGIRRLKTAGLALKWQWLALE